MNNKFIYAMFFILTSINTTMFSSAADQDQARLQAAREAASNAAYLQNNLATSNNSMAYSQAVGANLRAQAAENLARTANQLSQSMANLPNTNMFNSRR